MSAKKSKTNKKNGLTIRLRGRGWKLGLRVRGVGRPKRMWLAAVVGYVAAVVTHRASLSDQGALGLLLGT